MLAATATLPESKPDRKPKATNEVALKTEGARLCPYTRGNSSRTENPAVIVDLTITIDRHR